MTPEVRPLLPAPSCARECLLIGYFRNSEFLGLATEDGAAACGECLEAVAGRESVSRLLLPVRRERRSDPKTKVTCRWDEAQESLVRAMEGLSSGSSHLVWIQGHPAPRLTDLVGRRVGHMVPQATLVRRRTPREATGRLLVSLDPPVRRVEQPELARAQRIILWGCDPSRVPWWIEKAILEATAGGARILVVDPVPKLIVTRPEIALGLRPGTDVPLALALMSGVRANIRNRWHNAEEWDKALERWDPVAAAKSTGVSETRIMEAFRFLEAPGKAVLVLGGGPAHHPGGGEAVKAVAALCHLFDIPLLAPYPAKDPIQGFPDPIPTGRFEEVSLEHWDSFQSALDPDRTVVVLEGMDALPPWGGIRGMESFLSRARFVAILAERSACEWIPADLVLPVANSLESHNILGFFYRGITRQVSPPFPPPRDLPTLWSQGRLLARRLGWPENWFPAEEQIPERAAGECKRSQVRSFNPPEHLEPAEGPISTPGLFSSFRLVLLWSHGPSDPAIFGNNPSEPRLQMAPEDAGSRSVIQDAPVVIHNERGQVAARALINPLQTRGTVVLFWPAGSDPSGSFALFPSFRGGPESGDTFGSCLVEVQK